MSFIRMLATACLVFVPALACADPAPTVSLTRVELESVITFYQHQAIAKPALDKINAAFAPKENPPEHNPNLPPENFAE